MLYLDQISKIISHKNRWIIFSFFTQMNKKKQTHLRIVFSSSRIINNYYSDEQKKIEIYVNDKHWVVGFKVLLFYLFLFLSYDVRLTKPKGRNKTAVCFFIWYRTLMLFYLFLSSIDAKHSCQFLSLSFSSNLNLLKIIYY